jgi:hypothetical protein
MAQQIKTQNIALNETGTPQLKQGVARNRRISIEAPPMHHGRKSRRQRVDGYKRHVLRDIDSGLIPCVGVTPANAPEAWITDAIQVDLNSQYLSLRELSIDRAYLTSKLVRQRDESLTIYCKAWPVRHRQGLFPKTAFTPDWEAQTLCCPHQVTMPFRPRAYRPLPSRNLRQLPILALGKGTGLATALYACRRFRQGRRCANVLALVRERFGHPYRPAIASVLSATATFGRRMKPCYPASDIGQSATTAVKLITSSGSTARCDSGSRG